MSIKLVAIDIDGTLLNSKKRSHQMFFKLFKMQKPQVSKL